MPPHLSIVPSRPGAFVPADDEAAAAPEFPPGWQQFLASRRRFLDRLAATAPRDDEEPLDEGSEERWE